jgi:hypothetical protein
MQVRSASSSFFISRLNSSPGFNAISNWKARRMRPHVCTIRTIGPVAFIFGSAIIIIIQRRGLTFRNSECFMFIRQGARAI